MPKKTPPMATVDPLDYSDWLVEAWQVVDVTPLSKLPEIKDQLKGIKTRRHDCHQVAWDVAERLGDDDCLIIQGMILTPGVGYHSHSWNLIGENHFDLTAHRLRFKIPEYRAVHPFTVKQFCERLLKHDYIGDYLPYLFLEQTISLKNRNMS